MTSIIQCVIELHKVLGNNIIVNDTLCPTKDYHGTKEHIGIYALCLLNKKIVPRTTEIAYHYWKKGYIGGKTSCLFNINWPLLSIYLKSGLFFDRFDASLTQNVLKYIKVIESLKGILSINYSEIRSPKS